MRGYTVPTWYGKGGWGTLGLWQHLPGRHSLAEAWFVNNQVIVDELRAKHPDWAGRELPISEEGEGLPDASIGRMDRDASGMLWDRDVVAFYGDPALRCCFDPARRPWEAGVAFSRAGNRVTLRVRLGALAPGSFGGDQPFFAWLPQRVRNPVVVSGSEFAPVVTDDFILLRRMMYETNTTVAVTFSTEN